MNNGHLQSVGLLIIRIVIGAMFVYHGWPKLIGGIEKWMQLGRAMGYFGINFFPTFWGFMAAFSEFFGGVAFIIGLGTRVASGLLAVTMFVAMCFHFGKGDGLAGAGHALELLSVCIAFVIMGAGTLSIDKLLAKN